MMNRNSNLFFGRFRWLSLDGLITYADQKMTLKGVASNKCLLQLCGLLTHWNTERVSNSHENSEIRPLTIEDVHTLKKLIQAEINKAKIKQPEVIADQILFLTIGAIQIESQSASNAAWQLVNKTILSIDQPMRSNPFYAVGFLSILFFACTSMLPHKSIETKPNEATPLSAFTMTKVINRTDPVTISMLQRVHAKMKAGTCRLPQPEILPPEQQHAFLTFVNHGIIDVHHVEDLRLAIDYVNCLYPQEFLHPTPSYGNTL